MLLDAVHRVIHLLMKYFTLMTWINSALYLSSVLTIVFVIIVKIDIH